MACDAQVRACYALGRTSTPDREDAMRRLMVVIAIFGMVACSGTDSQGDGGQEAPACESHDDCGTEYCVGKRQLVCDGDDQVTYDCVPCDDPPCDPGAVCESGEDCKPSDACEQSYIDAQGDDCELQDHEPASCVQCYTDDQCRHRWVCQTNTCIG